MVDYTSSKTSSTGGGIGLFIAAGIVVLVLLYALFAGGSVNTTSDPASLTAPDAIGAPESTEATPVVPDAAPAATE